MVRQPLKLERIKRAAADRASYIRAQTVQRLGKKGDKALPVVPMFNIQDFEYLGQVSVGTPPQDFNVVYGELSFFFFLCLALSNSPIHLHAM